MKQPAIQFYVGDWRKDATVTCLSYGAKGLWFEMLLLMYESPRRGFLLLSANVSLTAQQIARSTGGNTRQVSGLLAEMEKAGTFSRNTPGTKDYDPEVPEGTIFNRRMVRDEKLRAIRAAAGEKGGRPPKKEGSFAFDFEKQNESKTESKTKAKHNPFRAEDEDISSSEEKVRVPVQSDDDYEWLKFRLHAEECGLSGSEPDWDSAQRIWSRLSTAEKIEAHRGLRLRRGTDDPALKSLPKNYLERKMWQRPIHQRKVASVGSEPLGEYRPDWFDGVYPETCLGKLNGNVA